MESNQKKQGNQKKSFWPKPLNQSSQNQMEENLPSQTTLDESHENEMVDKTNSEQNIEKIKSEKFKEFKENVEHNRKLHFIQPKEQVSGNESLQGNVGVQQRYNHFMSAKPVEGVGKYHWSK